MSNQHLIKTYSDRRYLFTTMVRHKGSVVALAMDDSRRIYYSVLNLGSADPARGDLDVNYWNENPARLSFPREILDVGFALTGGTAMPTVKLGARGEDSSGLLQAEEIDPFASTTARLTASAPFQALSDGTCIYVFRQSIDSRHSDAVFKLKSGGSSADTRRRDYVRDVDGRKLALVHNTLLVDRYLLVGSELQLLLDVRYQRSRHKSIPASSKDTLGVQDMDGQKFCEPTLCLSLVRNLDRGRFTAALLPTQIPDLLRWQIFAFNSRTGRIDSFNIERDPDGLFNTQGTQYFTSPDPQYRDAVFERTPGKCPFSGQDLVPIVSDTDYAETALAFDGVNDCVDLGTPAALSFQGGSYTFEAWVQHDGGGWLFTKWNEGVSGTLQIKIAADGKVAVVHGVTPGEVQTSISLPPGQFNHIAVTYNKATQSCVIYLNGEPAGSGSVGFAPGSERVLIGGFYRGTQPEGFFKGVVDEIRIWDRPRSLDELLADMKHRLIGNEPGLIAYYRFDEGEGGRLHDQTDSSCHGEIRGGASWVTSDAAVGDHPGVRRDSFGIAGRSVESGLAAQLYYMQQSSSSGYGESDKPVKRQARMLVAFATGGSDPSGAVSDNRYIATLDFAVARDGRLALCPDVVSLPFIGVNDGSLNLDRAALLETSIGRIESECVELRTAIERLSTEIAASSVTLSADKKRAEDKVLQLQLAYDAEKDVFAAYYYTLQFVHSNQYMGVAGASRDNSARLTVFQTSDGQHTHWRFIPRGDGYYRTMARHSGKVIDVAGANRDMPGLVLQWDDAVVDHQAWRLVSRDGKLFGTDFPLTPAEVEKQPFHLQVKHSGMNLDGNVAANSGNVFTYRLENADNHRFKVRRLSLISGVDLQLQTARTELQAVLAQLAQLALKQNELELKRSELGNRESELARLRSELAVLTGGLSGGEVTYQSQLLYIDRQGLTVTGGLLGFAYTSHAPLLFDSSTGDVILYFRGQTGQFFASYYHTLSSSGSLRLAMGQSRSLILQGRTPGLDLSQTVVNVSDGSRAEVCTVNISNGAYAETFPDVPRVANAFAAILNGTPSDAEYIGVVAENGINTDSVSLSQGTSQVLPAGALLRIGDNTARLTQEAPIGATQLKLASPIRRLIAGTTVDLIEYDYASAAVNRAGSTLDQGSLLLCCYASDRSEPVPNGTSMQGNVAQACAWRSDAPGRALSFSGDRPGLEMAWPPIQVLTAISLDGEADCISLGDVIDLRGTAFTIEFWYRREALDRSDLILSHGDESGEALRNLAVGFLRDNRFAFSFLGHSLDTPQAYTDLDWHHYAVTFQPQSRAIYRDGVLVCEAPSPTGYDGVGRICIGRVVTKSGTLFGKGCIDRVRVWKIARSPGSIAADFRTPTLSPASGLVAQWTFDCDAAKWDLAGAGAQRAVSYGAPQSVGTFYQIENTLSEDALAQCAPRGDISMEAWVNPGGFDGRRRIVYHKSAGAQYTLALEGVQLQKKEVISLDGIDDVIDFGSELSLKGCDFTVELWAKRLRTGSADPLLSYSGIDSSDGGRFALHFTSSDALAFSMGPHALGSPAVYTDLEWHHYAISYQAATRQRQIFRDGALIASDVAPVALNSAGILRLGMMPSGSTRLLGKVLIDEVRVWTKLRSASDLSSSLLRCLNGQESGLALLARVQDGRVQEVGPRQLALVASGSPAQTVVDLPTTSVAAASAPLPPQLRAIEFDAIDDLADFGSNLVLNSGDFTIEFWLRRQRSNALDNFVFHGQPGTSHCCIVIQFNPSNFFIFGFWGSEIVSPVPYADLNWHHYAVTYSRASGQRQLYRDGVLVTSNTAPTAYGGSGPLVLGGRNVSWDSYRGRGQLAEFRVWNRVRTQDEILANIRRCLLGTEAGLLALLQVTDSGLRDNGPAKLPGSIAGSPNYLRVPLFPLLPTPDATASLKGMEFDGVDDYIDYGSGLVLNNTDFTIEFWFRRMRNGTEWFLHHGSQDGVGGSTFHIGFEGDFNRLSVRDGVNRIDSPQSIMDLGWHHFAYTYVRSGGMRRMYIDGAEVCSGGSSTLYGGSGPLFLGSLRVKPWGMMYGKLQLAELRIWGSARSAAEISANMTRSLTGSEASLMLCAPLSGGQIRDIGPSRVSGTSYGSLATAPVPVLASTLPLPAAGAVGLIEGDGSDDIIECGSNLSLAGTDFTIELWARRSGTGRPDYFFQHGAQPPVANATLHLGWQQDNKLTFRFNNAEYLDTPTTYTDQEWHHLAFSYVRSAGQLRIFVDGVEVAARTVSAAYSGSGPLYFLGLRGWAGHFLAGQLAELRIWNRARPISEIAGDATKLLSGQEAGLLAYFSVRNGVLRDLGPARISATPVGGPKLLNLPLPIATPAQPVWPPPLRMYKVLAGVGSALVRSQETYRPFQWNHFAATFEQSWALRFDGSAYVDAGSASELDIPGELTIEVGVQVDRLGVTHGLLGKGHLSDGSGQSVPYQLGIDDKGQVFFRCEEGVGCNDFGLLSGPVIVPGRFHRIAVRRKKEAVSGTGGSSLVPAGEQVWFIRIYVDGVEAASMLYSRPEPTGHKGALEIGRIWDGSTAYGLRGVISEVRLWSVGRDVVQLFAPVRSSDGGLVAHFRLQEAEGNITEDSKGGILAKLRGAKWVKSPDGQASKFRFYVNGISARFDSVGDAIDATRGPGFAIAGLPAALGADSESYRGDLEELRVWRVVRSEEQILDNLFTRLRGEKQDLLTYYSFDLDSTRSDSSLVYDNGLRSVNLRLPTDPALRPRVILSTAPIANDTAQVRSAIAAVSTQFHQKIDGTPAVGEYADMQRTRAGDISGVMKRAYAMVQNGNWSLITGYKIGNLFSEWVGQAQFDPQIMGFIEGAPPVPSENLTAGALVPDEPPACPSLVRFVQSDDVVETISSSREASVSASVEMMMKAGLTLNMELVTAPMGIGKAEPVCEISVGLEGKLNLDVDRGWSSESAMSQGVSTGHTMQAQVEGLWEDPRNLFNPAIGRRWVPNNFGFALVQSQTADIFALRLVHNNALVAYRILPNPDIPADWNIIPFPINPRYTKQGTLDGAVGFNEQGKVLDPDYKNARGYGEYSYYKPREAYALKRRIAREAEKLRHAYQSYATTPEIGEAFSNWGKKMSQAMSLPEPPATASEGRSFDTSDLARRNLVNTYVWTAAGGFFAETTQTTDTVSETTGGSFSMSFGLSASISANIKAGAGLIFEGGFQLTASAGAAMSVSRSKSHEASRSFSLEVETAVPGNLQKYTEDAQAQFDSTGKPILAAGKVDAYRFMTFYLDASRDNFDDFFHKVVDPIWLRQSDAPNAVALRAAEHADKKPPCWRVFHRVTFVSRVLPPIPPPTAPPLEKAMRAENIASNYELIRQLEPYVKDSTSSAGALADATRQALRSHLPQLVPHADAIIQYLSLYYGVAE